MTDSRRHAPFFVTLLVTSFMLFSMFFGAGNLIFPPQLGAEAGSSFAPAIVGFLVAGVALPVLAIIAIAMSGTNVRDLAGRAGKVFGIAFPVVAYLSIGAFYALPRTGAVSFSTAVQPITGWDSLWASAAFNAVFFAIAFFLAYNPSEIVTKLGQYLTPALLVLLVVLVVLAVGNFHEPGGAPTGGYESLPAGAGLLQGYLTMDSIAALAFGIVVISALKYRGIPEGKTLTRYTIVAGAGAGVLLAIIYLGLGLIGNRMPHALNYSDGAQLLADAALQTMGFPGQVIFGLIVLLACMTTAVGLIAATSEFFHLLLPGISYLAWAVVFSLMSFGLATAGLQTVLTVAAPVVEFIYPPAITLILLTLFSPLLQRLVDLHWTYRVGIWVAVVWSAISVLGDLWFPSFSSLVAWAPLQEHSLGWVLPTLVALTVGFAIDVSRSGRTAPAATAG